MTVDSSRCRLQAVSLSWLLRWRSLWLVLAGLLGWVEGAQAQSQSVAILALGSDEDEALAGALTEALRSKAEADPALRLSSSRASLTQMTMAQDCEVSEPACRRQLAAVLAVQKVIYGELRPVGHSAYEVELHMFAATGGAQTSTTRKVPRGETSQADLARHATALLRGLFAEHNEDETEPVAATRTPEATPSRHAKLDATEPAEPHSAASNDWLGYTLLGVSGVSLGLMVFSFTQIAAVDHDASLVAYRKAVGDAKPSISNVCEEAQKGMSYGGLSSRSVGAARDACDRGQTFERLQYVFLGTALLAAGVGTYFLLDHEQGDHAGGARVSLRPSFGRSSGSLALRLQF